MSIDIQRARTDTPGCHHVLHFNNAGASLMPQTVIDAYTEHIALEAQIGGYEAADAVRDRHDAVYASLARLLGAHVDEIALTDSATRAWNMAFYGLDLKPGDRILTTQVSYAADFIAFLHRRKTSGVQVKVIPSDDQGAVDLTALDKAAREGAALIALTHVPTNGGLVQPAEEVGQIARGAGIPYLLDACQTAGQLPLSVARLQCDMLSATGRKYLRGPRGTGFLYVRREFLDRLQMPTPDLHSARWVDRDSYEIRDDAKRFELWESNLAGELGLGAAVDYALRIGIQPIRDRVRTLAETLRVRLAEISAVRVRDLGRVKCGIVTFTHDDLDARTIRDRLREDRINVSISDPESTLLDATRRGLPPMVRASVHYYNTDEEIERFCEALHRIS